MKKLSQLLATMIAFVMVFTVSQSLDFETNAAVSVWNGTTATGFASGTGTADDPYIIKTAPQLAYFAQQVNTRENYFFNQYVELQADIQLNDESFTFDPDTGLVKVVSGSYIGYLGTNIPGDTSGSNTVFDATASTAGTWYANNTSTDVGSYKGTIYEWTPIGAQNAGIDSQFHGHFDGKNHTISGLYVNAANASYAGLFGSISNRSSVKNLTVTKSFVGGNNGAGAIAGQVRLGTSHNDIVTISNCHNKGIVASASNTYLSTTGGIVGISDFGANIINCSNSGTILLKGYSGGIIGTTSNYYPSIIEGCSNAGSFYFDLNLGHYLGGIIGDANNTNILNCSNSATIGSLNHTGSGYISGIVAQFTSIDNYIAGCSNSGNILSSGTNCAGIVAGLDTKQNSASITSDSYIEIIDCHNYGNINADFGYGISGSMYNFTDYHFYGNIYDCTNHGKLNGNQVVGIGDGDSQEKTTLDIENCHNLGLMTANGGAYGISNGSNSINYCSNVANITATFSYGIGYSKTILNCYNTGDITGASVAAGIGHGNIMFCYNDGTISTNIKGSGWDDIYLGGISANGTSVIESCYNTGTIKATSSAAGYVGGIAGECTSITNCYNKGYVYGGKGFAVGLAYRANSITTSYNVGTIISDVEYGAGALSAKENYTHCYYLEGCAVSAGITQNARPSNVAGGQPTNDPAGCYPYSANSMKNTIFNGFYHDIWEIDTTDNYDYCTLKYFNPTATSGFLSNVENWSYDENTSTLTISTTATNLHSSNFVVGYRVPWTHLLDEIEHVVLKGGYLSIGDFSFANIHNLKSVVLPDSITKISKAAFYKCSSLSSITLPTSLKTVERFAFYGCDKLSFVYYYIPKEDITVDTPNNEILTAKWINPNEHNYQAVVTEPTCTAQGYTTYTCVDCSDCYISDFVDAKGHTYISTVVPPTCTARGYTTHTCADCGKNYKDTYVASKGHSYGEWETVTSPTCTASGVKKRTCSACGVEQSGTIPTVAHSYTETVVKPTCVEQGYTKHTCSLCGYTYNDTYTDVVAHTYGEWEIVTPPTCTESGTKKQSCIVCENTVTESVSSLGHSYTSKVVSPTCTAKGYTLYTCSTCDYSYKANYTSTIAHSYGSWYTSTSPTCTASGTNKRICSVCGNTQSQTVAAKGHSYGEWVIISQPTETEDGVKQRTCSTCKAVETAYYSGEHTFGEWEIITPATCTYEGTMQRICIDCGEMQTGIIPISGHSPSDWVIEYYPNCIEEGYERIYCTNCWETLDARTLPRADHQFEYYDIPASCTSQGYTNHYCHYCGYSYSDNYTDPTGHSFGEWYTHIPPGCESEGIERRECWNWDYYDGMMCRAYEERTVPATGHTYGEWEILENATCTEEGKKKHTCDMCGHEETEIIPKTAHTPNEEWYYDIYPSCESEGTEILSCRDCGEIIDSRFVPALGHSPDGWWEYEIWPTCETDGIEVIRCMRCYTTVDSRIVPAPGHNLEKWVHDPTCTREGYTYYYCWNCPYSYTVDYTEPAGHRFGEWYTYIHPTCDSEGVERRDCWFYDFDMDCECDAYEERTIPITEHTYGEWEILENATCTEEGRRKHTCDMCGHEETEIIPKTAHTPDEYWYYDIYPSCESEGTEVLRCTHCYEVVDSRTVPAIGHYYDVWVYEPSCTTGGYTYHSCWNCGHSYNDNYTSPRGHRFGTWYTDIEPGCETEGIERRRCYEYDPYMGYECEAYEENIIPALGHSYGEWEIIKEATFAEEGQKLRRCHSCDKTEEKIIPKLSIDSGECGDTLNWEFDSNDGKITIDGSGDMAEYESKEHAPWNPNNDNIKIIIIEKGVQSVSKAALSGYGDIKFYLDYSAEFKDTIKEIVAENSGSYAIFGDMNDDKGLNATDAVYMIDVIVGRFQNTDEIASDISRDGKFDLIDLIRLKKRMASMGSQGGSSSGGIPIVPVIPTGPKTYAITNKELEIA